VPALSNRTWRLLTLICMFASMQILRADGQRTHVEVGRRALDKYTSQVDEMLPGFTDLFATTDLKTAYYAGCMFPDWAFPNVNNPASEDAHWKRYQEPYFQRLVQDCPYPWNDEQKKRIAFFMGIVCHGMADLPWHFSKEGHASVLERSFANDRATHFDTEYSYDLFLYQSGTPPRELIPKLWWPIEDIKDAYRRMGTILPNGQLENMFVRTNVMINGGPLAASMAAEGLKKKYPWVKENVNGYYFGGVEHSGALTASWLKYYYARMRGGRYYQNIPTAVTEDNDERVYAGTTDTTLLESLPQNNTGSEPYLDLAGDNSKDQRQSLLRFDLTDWNNEKPIGKATLWLYFVGWHGDPPTKAKDIICRRVSAPWSEGVGITSDVNGTEGQPHNDSSATWSQFQQKLGPEIASTTIKADLPPGRWLSWDVTSAVRDWIASPSSNHGLQLSGDSSSTGIVRVYSSEAFRTQVQTEDKGGGFRIIFRPVLVISP
jgi:hypothetical protein